MTEGDFPAIFLKLIRFLFTMDSKVIDDLLGEFRAELNRMGNFKHVVNTELGLAEGWTLRGQPEKATTHFDKVKKYIAVLRASTEISTRELAYPIPRECIVNSSDNGAYIERLYAETMGKSPE